MHLLCNFFCFILTDKLVNLGKGISCLYTYYLFEPFYKPMHMTICTLNEKFLVNASTTSTFNYRCHVSSGVDLVFSSQFKKKTFYGLVGFVQLEIFSLKWRRQLFRYRASDFDLYSALMANEQ